MKKKLLIFSSSIVLLSALISSYNAGPANNGQNRTGTGPGATANCSSGGCHSGGTYTNAGLTIKLADNTGFVTTWLPGHSYTVSLTGTTTAPKYGFQLTAGSTTTTPAGTFTALQTATTHVTTVSGFQILEHSGAITATAGAVAITGTWVAPSSASVDTIRFYATVNNVNGTGSDAGDNSNNVIAKFGRNTASVGTLNADIKIAAFPNPVTDKLNISLENAENGTYTIRVFDMNGKVVANQSANVTKSYSTSINAAAWASGMYHVQLQKDGTQRTIAVVKQ